MINSLEILMADDLWGAVLQHVPTADRWTFNAFESDWAREDSDRHTLLMCYFWRTTKIEPLVIEQLLLRLPC